MGPADSVSALPAMAAPQSHTLNHRLLAGLLCGSAIVVIDFFIVLACLAPIERELGASKAQLQLVLATYAVANASSLILGGRLGDVLGRRRVLMWGLGLFAAASLACGLATSIWSLIVFRALQGLSGALIQPQVLGLLTVNFHVSQRARVFGLYAASLGFAAVAAQILGGLLVGLLSPQWGWRAAFIISVPLCLLALHFATEAQGQKAVTHGGVDTVGAGLLGLSLACVCSFLTLGREQGWPAWSWAVLALGAAAGAALVRWQIWGQRRGELRIMPQGILSRDGFLVSLLAVFLLFAGVASLYFVLALQLRQVNHYSALQVGLFFGCVAACFVAASMVKRFKDLVGRHWAEVGLVSLIAGHGVMLLAGTHAAGLSQVMLFVLSCCLQGVGIGSLMGPLMARALSTVHEEEASVAGGIAASMQQVGNSLGISAIGFAYFGHAAGRSSLQGAVVYLVMVVVALALILRREQARQA